MIITTSGQCMKVNYSLQSVLPPGGLAFHPQEGDVCVAVYHYAVRRPIEM